MTSKGLYWIALGVFAVGMQDRKSTRLNSSHGYISYAVFCLKKKINYRNASAATSHHNCKNHSSSTCSDQANTTGAFYATPDHISDIKLQTLIVDLSCLPYPH